MLAGFWLALGAALARADTFIWDNSCGDAYWHDWCEFWAGSEFYRDNNWDTPPALHPDLPDWPASGDDVWLASPAILAADATVNSLGSTAAFTLEVGELSVLTEANYDGPVVWLGGGFGEGQHFVNTVLDIGGPADKSIQYGTVHLAAPATWTGESAWVIQRGGVLNILTGALFDIQNDATFDFYYDPAGTIHNAGTLRKSGGTGITRIDANVVFNNTGLVEVWTGTLALDGGGSASGTFAVAQDATLDFQGSTYLLNHGASITGDGLARVVGATVTVPEGAAATVENLALVSGGRFGLGTLNATGTLAWTGGSLSEAGVTRVEAGGQLNIEGPEHKYVRNGQTLENGGHATWSGGGKIFVDYGGVLSNLAGGLFEALADGTFEYYADAWGTVHNAGTFRKAAGTGITRVDFGIYFDNSGLVEVQSGTLELGYGGAASGVFQIAEGAKVDIQYGTYELHHGASFGGAGFARITGASVQVVEGATVTADNLAIQSGQRSGTGALHIGGTLDWSGGKLQEAGCTRLESGATANLFGANSKYVRDGHLLDNAGHVIWSEGDYLYVDYGAVVNNLPGATFEVRTDSLINHYTGDVGTINNDGLFIKTAGAGTLRIAPAVRFTNTGTVQVLAGNLRLDGGGTGSGTFSSAADCSIDFQNGVYVLIDDSSFTGAGQGRLTGGEIEIPDGAAVTAENFAIHSGYRRGTGLFRITDTLRWTGDGLSEAGTTRIEPTAVVDINTGNVKHVKSGHELEIAGQAVWNEGIIRFTHGGTMHILPDGQLDIRSDDTIDYYTGIDAQIVNEGVLVKAAGEGTTLVDHHITVANGGTVEVRSGALQVDGTYTQTAGLTWLNGGTLAGGALIDIQGGVLAGSGSVEADVFNGSLVDPGPSVGQIAITGDYTQSAQGVLTVELNGMATEAYDRVTATGTATLDGALVVELAEGLELLGGDAFEVVSSDERSGEFATITGWLEDEIHRVVYTPGSVVLLVGRKGDMNCDDHVDFFDLDGFVLAITNPTGYVEQNPECNLLLADCNDDGRVDFFDIDPFVALVVGS